MTRDIILSNLVQQLVEEAYPELVEYNIEVKWGRTSCFAAISWTPENKSIRITCNKQTKKWHEAAIIGLLSHELSHPAQHTSATSERHTDIDVVERGLGPYLAVERAMTGKYEDYDIRQGKDKYLGYRTIRTYLTEEESQQLQALLEELRLVPNMGPKAIPDYHELSITNDEGRTAISVDGHVFYVDIQASESDIKAVSRNGLVHVYLNGSEIGNYGNIEH
jgi:hypothetical protein